MSATDIAKAFVTALEARDFNIAASYLSDDFRFVGPAPQPLGKNEFIGVQQTIQNAFPDWSFNVSNIHEEGDKVMSITQITGTQTGELNLAPLGLPPIPPTGKKVSLPKEGVTLTFRGNKITELTSEQVPDGGIPGLLAQLGVQMPHS